MTLAGLLLIGALALAGAYVINEQYEQDYEAAIDTYRVTSHAEAAAVGRSIEDAIRNIYQGIRTISQLPGVRAIDRHGGNLDANAHAAIEHIYKNMITNVSVSEIYIVPGDLNPEKVDAVTGELERPILMYDGQDENDTGAKPKITTVAQAENASELEIHEYRLLAKQSAYFRASTPNSKDISVANLPIIAGPEVQTCDNEEFEKTQKNRDRSGIVFSVPFFDSAGDYKGLISAVIRTNILKRHLGSEHFALINKTYNYIAQPKLADIQQGNTYLRNFARDGEKLYSEVLPVNANDPSAKWQLWAAYPDERFLNGPHALALQKSRKANLSILLCLSIAAAVLWLLTQARQQDAAAKERRKELNELATHFDKAVKGVAAQIGTAAVAVDAGAHCVNEIARENENSSSLMVHSTAEAAQAAALIDRAANELTRSIDGINRQIDLITKEIDLATQKSQHAGGLIASMSEKTHEVTAFIDIISRIASKINLLALNAAIEAVRAGQAGRGFAVVAGEVKKLAEQVSDESKSMTEKVREIVASTDASVVSFHDLQEMVAKVSGTITCVENEVRQQAKVASEITNQTSMASKQNQLICSEILKIQSGLKRTESNATEVLGTAKSLKIQAHVLRDAVDSFLAMISQEPQPQPGKSLG
jgi:methyl-accepting chemotaxis protein